MTSGGTSAAAQQDSDGPYLDCGLDSMHSLELIAELEKTFGICVTPDEIPRTGTLREVWEAMERKFCDANGRRPRR
ncbi:MULTISPECIES: acyl carrier protein [unclassified Nocardia]|uniref:acyl carrier protein n=1 Tax=unclassified Nocardia TaxID=2637762 RepID=UPI0035D73695